MISNFWEHGIMPKTRNIPVYGPVPDGEMYVPMGILEVRQGEGLDPGVVYMMIDGRLVITKNWQDDSPQWEDITPPGTRLVPLPEERG